MIKLIKYHVTKRPGRSPGAHIQRRDSMPGLEMNFNSLSNSSLKECEREQGLSGLHHQS